MVDHTIEALKKVVRDSGLRATPARLATLKLLNESAAPLTHAEVAAELGHLGIDKATIFRNLNDLVSVGLLRKAELGDHVWRFEVVNEHEKHGNQHPHFLCVDCGNVTCVEEVKLTANSVRLCNDLGEITEILLRGHCNACN